VPEDQHYAAFSVGAISFRSYTLSSSWDVNCITSERCHHCLQGILGFDGHSRNCDILEEAEPLTVIALCEADLGLGLYNDVPEIGKGEELLGLLRPCHSP